MSTIQWSRDGDQLKAGEARMLAGIMLASEPEDILHFVTFGLISRGPGMAVVRFASDQGDHMPGIIALTEHALEHMKSGCPDCQRPRRWWRRGNR